MLQQQHLKKCSKEYFPLLTLHYKLSKRNIIAMFMQIKTWRKKCHICPKDIFVLVSL